MNATPSPTLKGLRLAVYRSAVLGDCSNGGLSSRVDEVTLVGPDVPGVFEVTDTAPAVRLKVRDLGGGEVYAHVEPAGERRHHMAGGCLVGSSDSRFRELVRRALGVDVPALALHDRTE